MVCISSRASSSNTDSEILVGASTEYQAIVSELSSLDDALAQVKELCVSCENSPELTAFTQAANRWAEECGKCVSRFQQQIKKYHKGLAIGSGSVCRDAVSKIRWQISAKDDLGRFRAEICASCASINVLLATAGLYVI